MIDCAVPIFRLALANKFLRHTVSESPTTEPQMLFLQPGLTLELVSDFF